MAKKLTKEAFEEILDSAVEAFGYTYVYDQIRNLNVELNFDEDVEFEDNYWEETE